MSARGVSDNGNDQPLGFKERAIDKMKPISRMIGIGTEAELRASDVAANAMERAQKKAKPVPVNHDDVERWPLPGLAPMTRVRTSFGDVHSIALRKGDEVLTRSGEYKPILWMNRIKLDEHILSQKPDCNPVVFGAGSLGPNAPGSEIMLSPRQLICADNASGLREEREASMLVSRPGVRRLHETGLTYTVFHLGEAADVYCEGIWLRFALEA